MAQLTGAPIEDRLKLPVRRYWLDRAVQHLNDTYVGVPLLKLPEDLRVYEHLLWADRTDLIIEIGTLFGGSALWFRDRLRTHAAYGLISTFRIIAIDRNIEVARAHLDRADPSWKENICLVAGDICDESLPNRIKPLVPHGARCMVFEDSAHTFATTMAALMGFSPFVHPGGFFVVEDGCVDIAAMRVDKDWPAGVLPALEDWLKTPEGAEFVTRRDLELYGMTSHPRGFLQRRQSRSAGGTEGQAR